MGIKANYHTHTVRCKHATGTEREYVESAIKNGYKVVGFSDHTPQPYTDGFVSPIRMDMDELDGYLETIKALRDEYADRIDIRTGLEVEFFPAYFDELMKELDKRDIEYLILGQHCVPDEEYGFYAGSATDSEEQLSEYVDLVIEALGTGKFMYLAHPDLIHFTGPDDIYLRHMTRLCEYALDNNVQLEVNGQGLILQRWYPCERFFKLASGMGCSFIFGCDAHAPEHVLQPSDVPGLPEFMKSTGISF